MLSQNAEIANEYCELQSEISRLRAIIESGEVSTREYMLDRFGYPILSNRAIEQVGKSFIPQVKVELAQQEKKLRKHDAEKM